MIRRSSARVVLLAVALLLSARVAVAAPFTQLIAIGDSLTDNGNVFQASGQPPSPPYAARFSNGLVAVEYLAELLGIPLIDFAFGGATTGSNPATPVPDMLDQLAQYLVLTAGVVDPEALYFVWGGPNDLFRAQATGEIANAPAVIGAAVTNIASIVGTLLGMGAETVLVPGLPDIGLTPAARAGGDQAMAAGTQLTDAFNSALLLALGNLPPGWIYFDVAALMRQAIANPGPFGFENVTMACFVASPPSLCAPTVQGQNAFFFFDGVHPTTRVHQIFAQELERSVVPEPATLILLGTGLALGCAGRRARR